MANGKLIRFYISQVVIPIVNDLEDKGVHATKEEVDTMLKANANIDMSKVQMSNEELHHLILESFQFGDKIGLDLNYPEDKLDELIKLNIK